MKIEARSRTWLNDNDELNYINILPVLRISERQQPRVKSRYLSDSPGIGQIRHQTHHVAHFPSVEDLRTTEGDGVIRQGKYRDTELCCFVPGAEVVSQAHDAAWRL